MKRAIINGSFLFLNITVQNIKANALVNSGIHFKTPLKLHLFLFFKCSVTSLLKFSLNIRPNLFTMKYLYTFVLAFIAINIFGQIPAGYYDSAEGLQGEELKAALHNIIDNHIEFPYTDSGTDVWDILKESDRDPANSDNVILFYTGWSNPAGLPGEEYSVAKWSREHVWAKSRGDFGTDEGPGTDCHHLRPADISVNSARNNRWFNYCDEEYYDAGIPTGCYTSSTDWFWQPRNEVKGDVARMIFYMATRYEGDAVGEPDLEVIDYIPSDNYTTEPIHAKLDALLAWNEEDPVDDFERNRNEVVYSYQGNRNPFIDHPEYVDAIFNRSSTGFQYTANDINIKIFPNPCFHELNVELSEKCKIEVYSVIGKQIIITENPSINTSNWKPGIYFVVIKNEDGLTIKSEKIIKK